MAGLERGDPREIGRYRVLERLGAGGMGVVYLGRSPAGTLVAVKVVRPGLVGDGRYRARFRREVAAARSVTGAYTAPLVDADPDAEPPWLATAYLPGLSLEEAVGTFGALPAAAVRLLAVALAEALAGIHGVALAHRDLKPGNVMLTPGGPRVIDFGIARPEDSATLTQDGALLGTPGFMSPEQVEREETGPAADVFALGSVLAFATAGRGPFDAGNRADTLQRIQRGQADLAGVTDRRLRTVVAACLRSDPRRRPAAAALLDLLGEPAGTVHGTRWLPAALAEAIDARTARAPWSHAGAARAAVRPGEPTADPFAETAATAGAAGASEWAAAAAVTGASGADGPPGPAAAPPGGPAPRTRRRALLAALTAAGAAGAAALARPLLGAFDRDAPPGDRRPRAGPSGAGDRPPPEAERAWRVRVRDPGADPPDLHAAGRAVFVHGGDQGGVRALDPRTGDELWRRRWGSGAAGEFAAGDGTAYLVGPRDAGTQRVRALDPVSGGERWTYEREFGLIDAVVAAGGRTYVADGGVVALDTSGGDRRWSAGTTAFSLTAGSGIVLATDGEGVTAFGAGDGDRRWRHPADDAVTVLLSAGLAFVFDSYLHLAALPADGRPAAWRQRLTYPSTVHAAGGGRLYVSEPNGHLRALDAATGDRVWSSPDTAFLGIADGAVHVWGTGPGEGTGNGATGTAPRLYALDPAGGDVLWSYAGAEPVVGVTAGPGGLVFAGLANGYVEALRPPTARRPNGGTSGAA
ncbi:serine/threonine-protein kinase [Streptomyces sp. MAR4 CNX-425]|uniref:serine/threonine-protein kinase n=1 Tax=Streptomyces sp. MAR4 CNX-425 TaxID=3406343 RepID=UPI003B512195